MKQAEGTNMDMKKLVGLRKEAEKAVSDMADGPLKIKAFEVILSDLLQGLQVGGRELVMGNSKPTAVKKANASKDEKSVAGRILRLRDEGFFKELRGISEIRKELATNGWHYRLTSLSGPLQGIVQRRELRRLKDKEGNKSVWKYSEP